MEPETPFEQTVAHQNNLGKELILNVCKLVAAHQRQPGAGELTADL